MFEFESQISLECVFVLNMQCLFSQVAAVALMGRAIQWAAGPGHGGLSPTYRSKNVHSSHSLLAIVFTGSQHKQIILSLTELVYSPYVHFSSS